MPKPFKKLHEFFPLGAEQRLFYMKNPVKFVEHFIFADTDFYLSNAQKEILESIAGTKRTSVSSGRGLGKSTIAALAIIWFMVCFDDVKVALISPSKQQLQSVLYAELDKWLKISPFKDSFELNKERMYYKGSRTHFCELLVARKDNPEAVSGRHAPNMLFVVDEASNVIDKTLHFLDGSLTDFNNRILLISNPTRTQGFFFDTHHQRTKKGGERKKKRWNDFIFSALESPFVDHEDIERVRQYGEHSDQWLTSVLGQFPKGSPDSFIPLELVEQAAMREIDFPTGPLRIGVDVAGSGTDLATLCKAIGYKVFPIERKARTDRADEYVTWVDSACKELRKASGRPEDTVIVKVDDGGVGGHFVASALKAHSKTLNIDVRPTTFGGAGDKHYNNNTARMFDNLKKLLPRMDIPNDRDMIEEVSSRKYKVEMLSGSEASRIKMQTKDQYRAEFGKSPDAGDSLLLCMFDSQNPKTVVKNFDQHDKKTVVGNISYTGGMDLYTSVFYSRTGLASVVWVRWDGIQAIVTKELITDDNVARVASEIRHYDQTGLVKLIGNDRCFGAHGQDVKSQLRKYKVSLRQNRKYDELGAIAFLNQLVVDRNLKIYDPCTNMATQISDWRQDTSAVMQETDFGLCQALINVASELKQRVDKEEKKQPRARGYSEQKSTKSYHSKPWEKSFGW